MKAFSVIFWLGIAIAVMPYLGFPTSWKTGVYLVAGVLIAIIAFFLRSPDDTIDSELEADGTHRVHEDGSIDNAHNEQQGQTTERNLS